MLVTFLHGFGQRGRSWSEVISLLPAGPRKLAPDLRGPTMDDCLGALEAIWKGQASHLVGYSMGGRLALHAAARVPARVLSVVTVGAHGGLEGAEREARRAQDEALAVRIEEEGTRALADHMAALALFAGEAARGPEFVERRRRERLDQDPGPLAATLRGMGAGAADPVWEALAGFPGPATFVAGERDLRYARHARRLARTVPGGRAVIVPGSGHAVHLERPREFARLLSEHLAQASLR